MLSRVRVSVGVIVLAVLGSCIQLKSSSLSLDDDATILEQVQVNETSNGGWGADAVADGPLSRPCTVKKIAIAQIQAGIVNMSEPFIVASAVPWFVNSTSVHPFLNRYGDAHFRSADAANGVHGFPTSESPRVLVRKYARDLLTARNRSTVIWDLLEEPVGSLPSPGVKPHPVRDLREHGKVLGYSSGLPVTPDMQHAASSTERYDSFILAGGGTGTYIHFHGDAVAALGIGRKYWVLLPGKGMPGSIRDQDIQMLQSLHPADAIKMFTSDGAPFAKSAYQVCTQNAGDIIHVPRDWLHVTFNLWTSASVTLEAGYVSSADVYGRGHL